MMHLPTSSETTELTVLPEPTSSISQFQIRNMDKATENAIKEARLKEQATERTEVTDHCQEFRKNLHEVMNYNPDQPEY